MTLQLCVPWKPVSEGFIIIDLCAQCLVVVFRYFCEFGIGFSIYVFT